MTSVAIVREDGHVTTEEWGSPYILGAELATPIRGRTRIHPPGCDLCDFVRHALNDPVFAAEFDKGLRETSSWLRLRGPNGLRAAYRARRRRRR